MAGTVEADICVIGGGPGGLVVAAGAAQMGAATVLIERGRMGGDCLNTGCVPSKALLAAAKAAQAMRDAGRFGIAPAEPQVDFARVMDHVQGVIAALAPHDSVARFEGLGVRVIRAAARFAGPREVIAGNTRIRARRFVVATGSRPAVPPIPGLAETPFLTNETVWDNRVLPRHLIVIGGGPIGAELAQAHRRLGAAVTIVEMARLLPRDDPELAAVLRRRLLAEGVALQEGARVLSVAQRDGDIVATVEAAGRRQMLAGSHLLVAAGRLPNVEGLDLDKAGIRAGKGGIATDGRLRSSNPRVYAIGDVTGRQQFTHVAAHHAGIVLRNALFRLPARVEERAIPWVTYTDPELAHVGLTEAAAGAAGHSVEALRFHLAGNDRANAERATEGLIKVVATRRGRVLGASIAAANAGELILPWVLAIREKRTVKALASAIAPYPTLSEISKSAAGSFFTPKLFADRTRRLVRLLARFG